MRRIPRGFTLIELLVVVGVIAILMSLLLPVVARAREHAHLTGCMSNQRQIYTALKEFAQNSETITQSVTPGGNPSVGKADICPGSSYRLTVGQLPQNRHGIGQPISTTDDVSQDTIERVQDCRSALIVRGYLTNSSVFRCPERDLHPVCYNGLVWTPTMYHYAFNEHFVGDEGADLDHLPKYTAIYFTRFPNTTRNLTPVSLTRAKNPAGCVLITEDGRNNEGQRDVVLESPLGRLQASPVHSRRGSKADDVFPNNVYADYAVSTFVDGHTEALLVNTTLNDVNAMTVLTDNEGLR